MSAPTAPIASRGSSRRRLTRATLVAAALTTVAAGCSSGGSEDETEPSTTNPPSTVPVTTTTVAPTTTTEPAPTTTVPESTEPTDPPTTPATAPPTTTEEALKAQIAADYVRSWELRNELTSNPTLDNLDARVAEIAAVGTPEFDSLKAFVEELVAIGERTAPGDPDIFSVTVEDVTIDSSFQAKVTVCYVDNRLRLNSAGEPTGEFDELIALRGLDTVFSTDSGWLPADQIEISWSSIGVTSCPPA